MRFAPSNLNASNVNPSDIPSEQVLRQMGLSEEKLRRQWILNFKEESTIQMLDSSAFDLKNNRADNFI